MTKRKSSSRVTLVLIGAAAVATLASCGKAEVRRDLYADKADCLADWGNAPADCEPAYDRPTGSATSTHYYGRPYRYQGPNTTSPSRSGKTIGASSSVSRGGFGGSGHSASG